ncbi:carboxylesterase family protein, partial [Rhizobium ruizarguesonis]
CMQTDDLPKSEDCLTLNVWTPVKLSRTPLPVMVWIYGGALAHGNTAQYPGGQLAALKVVFVRGFLHQRRMGKITKSSHAVVHADEHN